MAGCTCSSAAAFLRPPNTLNIRPQERGGFFLRDNLRVLRLGRSLLATEDRRNSTKGERDERRTENTAHDQSSVKFPRVLRVVWPACLPDQKLAGILVCRAVR